MGEPDNGLVSAFAVRRSTRASPVAATEPLAKAAGTNTVKTRQKSSTEYERYRPSPAKRRKINGEAGYWATQKTSNQGIAKISAPLERPKATETYLDSESDELDSGEDAEGYRTRYDANTLPLPAGTTIKQLSSFIPNDENVVGELADIWTVRLDFKDTLTLVGQYDVWVRTGAINIMGAIIHANSRLYRVYSPSTNSLPFIRPVRDPFGPEEQPVVITILVCRSGIRLLRELSPRFRGIWNRNSVSYKKLGSTIDLSKRSFLYIKTLADDLHQRLLCPLEIPDDWQAMISQLRSTWLKQLPAVMICGPKGSGKSTFGRILANSLLNINHDPRSSNRRGLDGVAFLDLDPGQPEYSPPGEISLFHLRSYNLGVPFTHPIPSPKEDNVLIRAHHIGYVSFKDDPGHYQRCAFDLLAHYKNMLSKYPSVPLIVNCSGWIQGSGSEVLVELIRHWSFTQVVYTSTLGPVEVVETLQESAGKAGTNFSTLKTQQTQNTSRNAADMRMMQTLSYFHLDEPEGKELRWNSSLITQIPPLTVRYAGPKQDIFGIMIFGEEQDPEFITGILEGSVVGLVAIENDAAILSEPKSRSVMEQSPEDDDTGESVHVQGAQSHLWRSPTSSDSDSEKSSRSSSDMGDSRQQRQKRSRKSSKMGDAEAPSHLQHPSIRRTPEKLPYFSTGIGSNMPPDPTKSHSIGQALIRGINPTTQTLHLIVPAPLHPILLSLRDTTKIVLVRGRLDTPTWAYREEYVAAMSHRRQNRKEKKTAAAATMGDGKVAEREHGDDRMARKIDDDDEDGDKDGEIRRWAAGTPWAALVEDGKEPKGTGAKRWKTRRDFKRSSGVE